MLLRRSVFLQRAGRRDRAAVSPPPEAPRLRLTDQRGQQPPAPLRPGQTPRTEAAACLHQSVTLCKQAGGGQARSTVRASVCVCFVCARRACACVCVSVRERIGVRERQGEKGGSAGRPRRRRRAEPNSWGRGGGGRPREGTVGHGGRQAALRRCREGGLLAGISPPPLRSPCLGKKGFAMVREGQGPSASSPAHSPPHFSPTPPTA